MKKSSILLVTSILMLSYSAGVYGSYPGYPGTVVAGTEHGTVYVYDGRGYLLWSYDTGDKEIETVDVSADGEFIIVVNFWDKLFLFRRDGTKEWEKRVANSTQQAAAISDDGSWIVSGGFQGLSLYRRDGTLEWNHNPIPNESWKDRVAISPSGGYMAARERYDAHQYTPIDLRVFGQSSSEPWWTKHIAGQNIQWIAISESQGGFVVCSGQDTIYLYNVWGTQLWSYSHPKWDSGVGRITVDMSDDGSSVVAANTSWGGGDGCILCYFNDQKDGTPGWSAADGIPVWTFIPSPDNQANSFNHVAISGNGEVIATGPAKGSHVFSSGSNEPLKTYSMGTTKIFDLTNDGLYGVCGNEQGEVCFFGKDYDEPLWKKNIGRYVKTVALAVPSIVDFLVLKSPNGGDQLPANINYEILWQTMKHISNVDIEYSTDNGLLWREVRYDAWNVGRYFWLVPNTPSSQCLIRISHPDDENVFDISEEVFTILGLSLQFTQAPAYGEEILPDTLCNLQWDTVGGISDVDVLYSVDHGASWQGIETVPNTGSYDWLAPHHKDAIYMLRISDADNPGVRDTTPAFYIKPISVSSPNGGETLTGRTTHTIEWRNLPDINEVVIEYSLGSSSIWEEVNPRNTGNTGTYEWVVPDLGAEECYVRVTDANDPSASDRSDRSFTIVPTSLTVKSPNGGERILVGTRWYYVRWDTVGPITGVRLDYSTNNGSTWTEVDPPPNGNPGIYGWQVPMDTSTRCRVRVSERDNPAVFDICDRRFTIYGTLDIVSPNGGEVLPAGQPHNIQWNTTGNIGNVSIRYSTDNGSLWSPVAPFYGNAGTYEWNAPATNSEQCLVRIRDTDDSPVSDTSDAVFTIAGSLNLVWPNGGETLVTGETPTIRWDTVAGVDEVIIEYSPDNGSIWETVDPPNTGNTGTYDWHVVLAQSDECLVRVSNADYPSVFDTSDDVFQITALRLDSPNGGEALPAGRDYLVQWQAVPEINEMLIEYSWDGSHWTEVNLPNNGNTGSYDWLVPAYNWDGWLMRISDANEPDIFDISDDVFTMYECQDTDQRPADLDDNCYVDEIDSAIFSSQWKQTGCNEPNWCNGADLDKSGDVDWPDFAIFASQWLYCGNPYDLSCECLVPWPDCWHCPTQCYGDADCAIQGNCNIGCWRVGSADYIIFYESFNKKYPDPDYDPCADFNRDLRVDLSDMDILMTYWEISEPLQGPGIPADCPPGVEYPWPPPPELLPTWP